MANPAYYETSLVSPAVQQREHLLHLYMYQIMDGQAGGNQKITVTGSGHSFGFGAQASMDWTVYDDILPKGKLVARAQGVQINGSMDEQRWCGSFNLVFTDDRFKKSGLRVEEINAPEVNEYVIVGGAGEFAGAQGNITFTVMTASPANIRDLHIRFVCPSFTKKTPSVKVEPPVGGDGGQAVDVTAKPQRLLSVTIGHGDVIDSISYSYVDESGKNQTAGRWGGTGGLSKTIQLAANETVKKIMVKKGNFGGHDVVTSLTLITNLDTYGPYGKENGTQFVIPEKETDSVVGFHGRAALFVNAIGIYTTTSVTVAEN